MSSPTSSLPLFLCLLALPTSLASAQGNTLSKADREAEERRIRELDRRWVAAIAKKDVAALGGPVERIVKPGADHHPHGLSEPRPIVEFFERAWKTLGPSPSTP